MLKNLLARVFNRKVLPSEIDYVQARDALETQALAVRRELAARDDVEPEILYYLAQDASPDVRRGVAANAKTPQQANKILADDENDDVRCELATKIARLVPTLDSGTADRVLDLAIEVLEKLAADKLPRVRQIIAEEIKYSTNVPPTLVRRLARDVEAIVSAPILEYSPLLSDEDLIEIIASGTVTGALQAVSRRRNLAGDVANAVVATLDIPAVAALLTNPTAQIREDTLDRIIENAEGIEDWHQPLVLRPDLSMRAVRRISGFVAYALLEKLQERTNLDEQTATAIKKRVRERIAVEDLSEDQTKAVARARERVSEAQRHNALNDAFIIDALEAGDRPVVLEALATLAGVPPFAVDRIIAARSGKALTSLVWKAGLSMRTSLKLQAGFAKIPVSEMVLARNGVDFPLEPSEMSWHLNYFGVAA